MLSLLQPALNRARAFFRRRVSDVDMAAELQMHIEALAERNRSAGMTIAESRDAALREFGGVEQITESCRDERSRGLTWLYQLGQDARYATRQMRKAPGFTAIAVLSLGIALGVNTAIFSLVDAVLLRTLPVRDAQQLVLLTWEANSWPAPFSQTGGDTKFSFSYPAFERLRKSDPTAANVFAFVPVGFNSDNATVVIGREPLFVQAVMVSDNFFTAMGAEPKLGRGFNEADAVQGRSHVAVISDAFWADKFNRNPRVLGRAITVNETPFTIIGVAPAKFYGFASTGSPIRPDIWIPFSDHPSLRPWGMKPADSSSVFTANNWICLNVGARIAPTADRAATTARLEASFKNFVAESWIQGKAQDLPRLKFFDASTALASLRGFTVRPLSTLTCAAALVLVIACANLASLLIARANARQKELSVRVAMGASRGRILRQLLTESVLLSALGGAVGLLFAAWGSRALLSMMSPDPNRMAFDVAINGRVFFFTGAVVVLTGILFGGFPAWRGAHRDPIGAMKQRASTGEDRHSLRLSKSLVAAQLAVSLVLMISAGLFARTLQYMEHRNLGFRGEGLLLFGLDPTRQGVRGDALLALYERIRLRVAALPGIEAVTLYEQMPFQGSNNGNFKVDGSTPPPANTIVRWAKVGPNFCDTMKIALTRGRDLHASDNQAAGKVGLVNETFVQKFLGNELPLGRHFYGPLGDVPIEIVGVVRDVELTDLHSKPSAQAFVPYLQAPAQSLNTMYFEVRTSGEPLARAADIRAAVGGEAPRTPLIGLTTQLRRTAEAMAAERMFARLATLFSGGTLLLSCIGLYGTVSYQVSRRGSEFGLRIALGATPRQLLNMVVMQSLRIVAIGVAAGLLLSAGATRLIRSMLYGVGAGDPATFLAASILMVIVALLACWVPARRAASVDPLTSLRTE